MLVRFLVRQFLQMGGSTSKPAPTLGISTSPGTDLSKIASVSYEAAQQAQQQALEAGEAIRKKAEEALLAANLGTEQAQSLATTFKWVSGIVGFIAVAFGVMLLYDYLAIKFGWPTIPWFTQEIAQPIIGFKVVSANYNGQDVTSTVQSMVVDGLYLPPISVTPTALNVSPTANTGNTSGLVITYSVNNGPAVSSKLYAPNATTDPLPTAGSAPPSTTPSGTPSTTTSATAPTSPNVGAPLLTRMWNYVTGSGSSGNMLSTLYDATTTSSISAANMPLSDQTQGAYGMQWWMFIKDWNYGFGAQKNVIVRSDPTNSAVVNPKVTLHPTDNTLQVTVSLFSEGGNAAAGTPVAAGSGSATEDVYVCEVADVPLQSWFAVGVSVYGRNLDVYINGNLVKTCFLPGVPKPAAGNVQLTPGGGFSGYMCGLTSVSRMLTPGDTSSFYSAGTSCQNQVPTGGATPSGYAVKFGVYNPSGKQVQQYTF